MLTYLRDNLAGAFAVMLGRPEGLDRLDVSLEGFWRSFSAFILVLPFALLAIISQEQIAALGAEGGEVADRSLPQETAVLLLDWLAFPLIFALAARPLGVGPRYVPFIVARNWGTVVVGAMLSLVHALHLLGVLPTQLAAIITLVFVAVALRFSYMITRIALAVPMRTAVPIVAFDFLLSLTIWSAFSRLQG